MNNKKTKIGNDERRVKRYIVNTCPLDVREMTFLQRQLGDIDEETKDGKVAVFQTKAQAERFTDFAQTLITACAGEIESVSIVLADERLSKEFEAGIVSVYSECGKKNSPKKPRKPAKNSPKKTQTPNKKKGKK